MSVSRALVWDMDGVIVDSASAHNASWVHMAREYGVDYDPERDFKLIFGRHNSDIISSMWGVTDPEEIERMAESKESAFRSNAMSLQALPGVLDLMHGLQRAGWKQGIGSSAPLKNIHILLKATGAEPFMDAISSGDDVTEGKPNPQVFLIAFSRLEVEPRNGVVIEDAPVGILAGLRSGAATLGVTNTQPRQTLLEAGATRVVESLQGFTVADLEKLVAPHR